MNLSPTVSRSGRLRKGWRLHNLFQEKSMENFTEFGMSNTGGMQQAA